MSDKEYDRMPDRTMSDKEYDRRLYVWMAIALGFTALMVVLGMVLYDDIVVSSGSGIADDMLAAVMEAYPGGGPACHAAVIGRALGVYDTMGDGPYADDDPFGRMDYHQGELVVRIVAEADWQPPECAGGD